MTVDLSTNKLKFLVPSVLDVFFVFLFFYIFFVDAGAHILRDADTGFHIMVGRFFLENQHVPTVDLYSHTVPGQNWVAFSWGTGVLFALFDKLMGLNGVVLLSVILIMLTLFIIYRLLIRWQINFFIIAISIFFLTALTSVHWLARPHLFTLFFTSLVFYVLESAKDNNKLYYFIPFIMMIWVNMHPGFISGFFLLILYFTGNLIELLICYEDELKQKFKSALKHIFIVFIGSFLLTLFNPYGIDLYYYIFETLKSSWIVNVTLEYRSPDFHHTFAVILYLILVLASLFFALRVKNRVIDMPKILVFLLWLHLSLFALRNIAIFSVIGVCVFALLFHNYIEMFSLKRFKEKGKIFYDFEKSLCYHVWPLILLIIIIVSSYNSINGGSKNLVECAFSPKELPINALKYLEKNPLKGNMFNLDNWGGYIIYAYPDIKVFMDGRLDMYQQKFIGEYQKVVGVSPDWQDVLNKYNVDWVLISNNTLLYNMLAHSKEWSVHYTDKLATIYKRNQK
ncbi:MAG: hypothetical protein AB7V50_04620 [Vampirovibrionia bacterium]